MNPFSTSNLFEFISIDDQMLSFIRLNAKDGLTLVKEEDYTIQWADDAFLESLDSESLTSFTDKNGLKVHDKQIEFSSSISTKLLALKQNPSIFPLNEDWNLSFLKISKKNYKNNVSLVLVGLSKSDVNTASDSLLESILDNQPYYIFRIDENAIVTYCNKIFKKIFFGINKSIKDFVHINDLPLLLATFESAKKNVERHFPIRLNILNKLTDTYQLLECDFQAKLHKDNSYSFQVNAKNANQATLSKAHLLDKNLELSSIQEALYNSSIIAIVDLNGIILEVNDLFCKVSGYPENELIGQSFDKLSSASLPKESLDYFWEKVAENNYWRGEISNVTKNGKNYWLDTVISPVLNSDGKAKKYISISQDITKIKETQSKLRLAKDQLEQTGKLARVGGWELNIQKSQLNWTSITKEIHEVSPSFVPQLSEALNFYKEGRDRERITFLVTRAIETGTPWDEEFNITTATGKNRWVRVIGEAEFDAGKCVRVFGIFQDVQQLKQTQISDALNAARLEVAAENSGIGIWEYDDSTQREYWDDQMLQLYGYKREEYDSLQDPWEKKLYAEDFERAKHEFEDAFANQSSYDSTYRIELPSKEIRYLNAKGRIFRDDKGQVVSIIGTNVDVTAQKQLEDALRYNQYILELSGKLAQIGAWVVTLGKKKTVEWSDTTRIIHGVPKDYIPDFDKVDHFYNFDNSSTDIKKLYYQAIRYRKGFDVEFRIKKLNNEIRWVRSIAQPEFNEKGKCTRIIGTLQDITQQKEEAERLRTAEKIAGIGTFEYFLETDELYWSDIAKEIFEIDKERYSFKDYYLRIHKDDRQKAETDYRISVESNAPFKYTHRLVMDDGRVKYATFTGENLINTKGKTYISRGTVQDITKEKIAELELIKSRTEAIEANKAKSNFLANMSHEIRTPLNGVIGFNELLSHTPLNEVQRQYVDNASTSAQTLLSVLNDILDFSKIEAGKLELDPTKANLVEIVESAANIFNYAAQNKGLEIFLDIQPDVPPEIVVDQLRLKQVLTNLMSNAVKFTEKGSVRIGVQYKPIKGKEPKQGKFIFSITDTGIGISRPQRLKLFKAFSQADPSTSRKYGGTGLGLVISNLILNRMRAKLKLKSELEKGSTFYFELKLAYNDELSTLTAKARTSQQKSLIDPEHKTLKPINVINDAAAPLILIVEDVSLNSTLAKALVKRYLPAANVHEVVNGEEAVAFYQKNGADLIFMDIQMPIMDGYEATKRIRAYESKQHKSAAIIVALTAHAFKEEEAKVKKIGMDDILTKPIEPDKISDTLSKYFKAIIKDQVATRPVDSSTMPAKHELNELYDYQAVLNRFLFDDELIAEMLITAKTQINDALVLLTTAIKERDASQIEKSAHKIKGIAKNMSFLKIIGLASELEEKSDESHEVVDELYKKLDESINSTLSYLGL